MSVNRDEIAGYVDEKLQRSMAVFALRRMRAMIDRDAADELAKRRFTIRALLWLAVVFLGMPMLAFCFGALSTYLEFRAQGQPLAVYFDRFYSEVHALAFMDFLWVIPALALFRHHRVGGRHAR